MRFRGLLMFLAVAAAGSMPRAMVHGDPQQPTTKPLSAEEEKKQEFAQEAAEVNKLPAVSAKSPAEVIRFSIESDMLVGQLVAKYTPEFVHIILPNPAVVTVLKIFKDPAGSSPDAAPRFSLALHDFSPGEIVRADTMVSSIGGQVIIARDYETATVSGSIQLIQDAPPVAGEPANADGPVRLLVDQTIDATGQKNLDLKLSASTFVELCRSHSAEVDRYLRPVLHDLDQETSLFSPDAKAIWQVLSDDCKPDDETGRKVKAILAQFSSDRFRERQSGASALESLGEPAAIVLMHTDRSALSPEQNSGIDTFLATYLPLAPDDAKRLGNDVAFLLNCQYNDDAALRRLAAARLAKLIGRPCPVNPDSDAATRAAAILKARDMLLPPATAPSIQGS